MRFYIQEDTDKIKLPIIVRNGGFQDTNVTVTFTVPAGLTVYTDLVIKPNEGSWSDPVWTIGTMVGDNNYVAWLPLEIDDITSEPFTVSYVVAGDNIDPNLPNNTTTYTLTSRPVFQGVGLDAAGKTAGEGEFVWNDDEGTFDFGMKGGNVTGQGFQEQFAYIRNDSGGDIDDGEVVSFAGTIGASGRLLGDLMIADGTIEPEYVLGIATEDILDGQDGYVTTFGKVRGLDTTGGAELWNDGDILYASPTVPGALTNVAPSEHELRIKIAAVVRAHASTGILFVRPTISPRFQDIHHYHLRTEVADYTIDPVEDFDGTILADVGCDQVNLPDTATMREGDWFIIKQIDVTTQLLLENNTLDASTIDGATNFQFTYLNQAIKVQFDGTNWQTIAVV